MIITRTPFRISFFGGGSDYPAYYREHGGLVLSSTINKYCYITTRYLPPFFDHKFRMRYTKREETQDIDGIVHPSARECLRFLRVERGVEMVHTSDIPALSGMGSSSAFTVGFLLSLYSLLGRIVTKRKLSEDAIHVEQEMIGETVGSQDQVAAAFGGFNCIRFGTSGDISVTPLTLGEERLQRLQDHLLLCFTGFQRYASSVAVEQVRVMRDHLRELGVMKQLAEQALEALNTDDGVGTFGALLDESWQLKRQLSDRITSPEIDAIYEAGRRAGAVGGKLCGAGGGGFMLLFAPPERHARIRAALPHLLFVPFRFETLGAHVAFYSE